MIEQGLITAFKGIFDLQKVTFNAPSDSHEQDCLFVEVDQTETAVKDNVLLVKAMGRATLYARMDKLPLGYFEKKIQEAAFSLTKDFFFYNMGGSDPISVNLVRRTFSFVYFFSSQYNPHNVNISTLEITGD